MTKITNTSLLGFISIGAIIAVFIVSFMAIPKAHAAINTQLDPGSSGSDVTQLQKFLASNSLIYPSGIVTGYYGPLTQAAVKQFQLSYDISPVGRVGPQTQGKINSIMASGLGLDISAPGISNVSVQTNRTNVNINKSTNEVARGQVYYDTSPLQLSEATMMHGEQPYVSGTPASDTQTGLSQTVTLQNLQPNTIYYYLTRAIDNSGNVSMTMPSSFRTNQ